MSHYLNAPVVGVDVSADFSMVAILDPAGRLYRKPFRISHDSDGFDYLLAQIKKAEQEFTTKVSLFMEATGIYHLTLFCFLKDNKVDSFVINPLVTNCNKNKNIRKVKNDKIDSISIAKIGKYEDVKASSNLDVNVYMLRNLCREYYGLVDARSNIKKKLSADLRIAYPGYQSVFSDVTGNTSLAFLMAYPSPQDFAAAPKNEVLDLLASHSRKGLAWACKKYNKLLVASDNAMKIGFAASGFAHKVQRHLNLLAAYASELDGLLEQINDNLSSDNVSDAFKNSVSLLSTMPGIGYITAITIACEIGDITRFQKPKQLVAFFGIDPSVSQSGKFNSTENKMSKRGTRIGRRALYAVALSSVRKKRNGEANNPVLLDYYNVNMAGKKKKVGLVAIMHKLLKYIFAILKNEKPFEARNPKLHARLYLENHIKSCA